MRISDFESQSLRMSDGFIFWNSGMHVFTSQAMISGQRKRRLAKVSFRKSSQLVRVTPKSVRYHFFIVFLYLKA